MENANIILVQIIVMFVLILFGAFLYKRGVFSSRGGKQLSNFVVSAVSPVLIFVSFQKDYEPRLINGLLLSFLMSFIAFTVLIVVGTLCFRKKKRGENYCIEQYAAAYSNCGFLGIPLVQAVYGTDGVLFLTAFIALFNLLSWTHGVMIMTGKISFKSLLNVLKAPAVIATAAGIVCFFVQIRMPKIVLEPMEYIASLNTPLAMVVSGITIAQSDLRKALKKSGIYLTALVKLIAAPLVITTILVLFRSDEIVTNSVIIACSAPTGATTVMFANKFGKDSIYAAEIFAVSTLLSVITMPLMLIAADCIGRLLR